MNRLLNNWSLKLTSLVLAIALWGHVRGEINPLENGDFDIPLDANVPAGFQIVNAEPLPATVRITVRAPRAKLRELKGGSPPIPLASPDEIPLLTARSFRAYLDSASLHVGENSVPVRVDSNVEDANVRRIKPAEVSVTLRKASSE